MLRDGTSLQINSDQDAWPLRGAGIINERIGTDGFQYGDMFEVRLPALQIGMAASCFRVAVVREESVPPATGMGRDAFTDACAWMGGPRAKTVGMSSAHLPHPNAVSP